MTPFGEKVRALRAQQNITLKQLASALGVSSAYLSALEHGNRGKPARELTLQICSYFDLVFDESEALKKLAEMSHPRVVVNTAGLSPRATELANLLSKTIDRLDDQTIDWIVDEVRGSLGDNHGPTH